VVRNRVVIAVPIGPAADFTPRHLRSRTAVTRHHQPQFRACPDDPAGNRVGRERSAWEHFIG